MPTRSLVSLSRARCLHDSPAYFPTYTLGAMAATQIFETAKEHLPDLDADIRAGNFKPLREWLRVNVHELGSRYERGDEERYETMVLPMVLLYQESRTR